MYEIGFNFFKMYERLRDLGGGFEIFVDRELTEFEKRLFNGDEKPDLVNLDLDNIEIVNALSLYYRYIGDDILYITFLERLNKLNDRRGYERLGLYYLDKGSKEKAYDYFNGASNLGSIYAKATIYQLYEPYNIKLMYECLLLGDTYCICSIALYQLIKRNFEEAFTFIAYGLYKELPDCLELLEYMIPFVSELKKFSQYLKFHKSSNRK